MSRFMSPSLIVPAPIDCETKEHDAAEGLLVDRQGAGRVAEISQIGITMSAFGRRPSYSRREASTSPANSNGVEAAND